MASADLTKPSVRFGTDGWRAPMDQDFTFQNVELVAQAFADFLNGDFEKRSLARLGT